MIGDEADDFSGAFAERSAGKAARFRAVGHALNAVARDGRVGGDHGVDAALDERVDATQDLFVFKIGGKLDSDGHVLAVAGVLELLAAGYDAGNKMVELVGALKLAKILRVGRGDVDGDVVGVVVDLVEALFIVGKRIFDRRDGVLADVDAENAAAQTEGVGAAEVFDHLVAAFVVEAHAVDDALGRDDAEAAGLRIAGLGERRDRADFDVAEAEGAEGVHADAVLVHAGGKTDRVGEAQAHHFNRILVRHVRQELVKSEMRGPVEVGHGDVVSGFRLHRKQHAAAKRVKHDDLKGRWVEKLGVG